jgi:hypothetical protein
MNVIVLNPSNINTGTNNSTLTFNFPNSATFKDHEIAVSSVNMYYCWANISTALGNNVFSYRWTVGVTTTSYTVTIPDGLYEVSDINNYLQYKFIMNGTYLINSGKNVYYAEFLIDPNRYAVNIITYPVPTSLPSGYTLPTANTQTGAVAWGGFPTSFFNPSINVLKFNTFLGFTVNFTTSLNVSNNTILSLYSTTAPNVSTISSLFLTVSNISNPYTSPSNILYNIVPDVGFGELINNKVNEYIWTPLLNGTISSLTCRFIGNDFSSVNLLDGNITIVLLIRKKPV